MGGGSKFESGGGSFRPYEKEQEYIPGINERKRVEMAAALQRLGIFQLAEPPDALPEQNVSGYGMAPYIDPEKGFGF